jgi:hypothetical protein
MGKHRADRSTARLGAVLLALGAAPFAAAAAFDGLGMADAPRICPFSLATGAPCPLCGSTRAYVLATQGDPAFLDFNAVWVVVAAAVALAGAALLLAAAAGRRVLSARHGPWLRPAVLLVVVGAWAWALAHRDQIVA